MAQTIVPAATMVLLRKVEHQLQVLLLRRNPKLAFAGNTWVFPGGRLESDDTTAAGGDFDSANRIAAVRECHEECGVIVDPAMLVPISHWTTPDLGGKRFATQFFICHISGQPEVTIDNSEIVEYQWLDSAAALAQHQRRELAIMPPTLVTLSELAARADYESICAYYRSRESRKYNPRVKFQGKADGCFLYEGDSGYEEVNPENRTRLNRCEMRGGVFEYQCNLD